MASPFRYFRKHTKAFMAIAAVICIFLFVFSSATPGSSSSKDDDRRAAATVATWNGGSLNQGQLAALVYHRQITDEFLQLLFVTGGGRTVYDLPPSVPHFLLQTDRPDELKDHAIDAEVFSNLATQAGMSVSDAMINHYLEEFGLDRVDSEQIISLLARVGQGNVRANEAIVFQTLRKLLLADFYKRSFKDASELVLPQQRWEDWRRVNERISLQVAKLPAESFLVQVPQPTDEQLTLLYNQFKELDPGTMHAVGERRLPSPEPGFAVPRRLKLQYLVGNMAERTEKLLSTITDAEIADYYERNKRSEFVKMDVEGFEDFNNEAPSDGDPEADPTGADGSDASEESVEESAESAAPAAGADAPPPAAEGETPPGEASETPAAEAETPAADEPTTDAATEEPAAEAPAAPPAAPAEGGKAEAQPTDADQSRRQRRSPFRFAALQAPAENDADAAPGETSDAESTPEADSAAPGGAVAETPIESNEPAESPPSDAAADPARETTEAADATGGATDDAAASPAAPSDASAISPADALPVDPEPEFLPLDEVRDEIRRTLARDKAGVELQQQMSEAMAKLQTEYNRYGRQVIESRELKQPLPAAPEKLKSLQWLADEYGLTLETTDALTPLELVETPVGKAVDDQSGRTNVTMAAMSLELHEPFLAKELDGNWYLTTKIEDTPRRIPSFDEARDQVAAAWRRIEAAKLSEKKAEELAKASSTSAASFADYFQGQGYEVVPQTALFSWLSYDLGPGMGYAQFSDVPELKNVGPAFMAAAFGLKDGETKAVMNYDRSSAYVIRLHSRQYTPEELRKLFLAEDSTWAGRRDMQQVREYQFNQLVTQRIWKDLINFEWDPEWQKEREAALAERN